MCARSKNACSGVARLRAISMSEMYCSARWWVSSDICSRLAREKVSPASRLASLKDGTFVRVAGAIIVRQRPGTAKGFVFLSLEDETGIANIIITPQLFEQDHTVVVHNSFLLIEGILQNLDGVISVKITTELVHLSRDAFLELVDVMMIAADEAGCVFDGFQVDLSDLQRRPWWKLW